MVVAQLAERSLLSPEIQGSDLVIESFITLNCVEKMRMKKKEAGNGPKPKNLCLDLISLFWSSDLH